MRPIIGSSLPRETGLRFMRSEEPFPGVPWKAQPAWNLLRDALIMLATLLIIWAGTCLAFSLEMIK